MRNVGRLRTDGVFKNVGQKVMNTAQRHLVAQLPSIMSRVYRYALNHSGQRSMTGNWINSFGVVLYRDGRPVAFANTTGEGNVGGKLADEPVRTTLINDDIFKLGMRRHDKSYQKRNFEVGYSADRMGTSSSYFADDEVIRWLANSRSRVKGFSYRVVSVTEYKRESARRVLFQISNEIESFGGKIFQFKLG